MATISSLSASTGHAGTTLTITGTGLGTSPTTTKVNFGARKYTPNTVSQTSVAVTVPVLCTGQTTVSVTAAASTSNTLPFFYTAAPDPQFSSPNIGSGDGVTTTPVILYGSGFLNTSTVQFGGVSGTALTVTNDSQLSVTAPAQLNTEDTETVEVVVTTPGGGSNPPNGIATQFTYYKKPTVIGISPTTGGEGTSVTVQGTSFIDVLDVIFTPEVGAPVSAGSITSVDAEYVVIDVPPGLTPATTYDIQVITPGGTSDQVPADEFTAA